MKSPKINTLNVLPNQIILYKFAVLGQAVGLVLVGRVAELSTCMGGQAGPVLHTEVPELVLKSDTCRTLLQI